MAVTEARAGCGWVGGWVGTTLSRTPMRPSACVSLILLTTIVSNGFIYQVQVPVRNSTAAKRQSSQAVKDTFGISAPISARCFIFPWKFLEMCFLGKGYISIRMSGNMGISQPTTIPLHQPCIATYRCTHHAIVTRVSHPLTSSN